MSLRTTASEKAYHDYRASLPADAPCALCATPAIQTFKLWKIIPNKFPYDKVAKTHHMIVPLRHTDDEGVNQSEWQEYQQIKRDVLFKDYEYLIEASAKKRSIPGHFHMHLIVSFE